MTKIPPELLEKLIEKLPFVDSQKFTDEEESGAIWYKKQAITALPSVIEAYNAYLVGEMEKLRNTYGNSSLYNGASNRLSVDGYNHALDDIITLITNQTKS